MDATRALIADLVSEQLSGLLTRQGYELVASVATGTHAVARTCALRPDVVLMDVRRPEVDGLEATRRIRECCPTPVVVTAHETPDLLARAGEGGVVVALLRRELPP